MCNSHHSFLSQCYNNIKIAGQGNSKILTRSNYILVVSCVYMLGGRTRLWEQHMRVFATANRLMLNIPSLLVLDLELAAVLQQLPGQPDHRQ